MPNTDGHMGFSRRTNKKNLAAFCAFCIPAVGLLGKAHIKINEVEI